MRAIVIVRKIPGAGPGLQGIELQYSRLLAEDRHRTGKNVYGT
jgi:hypothetical protein